MQNETYNGWTNYETWNVNLWLGDEEDFRDRAMNAEDLYQAEGALRDWVEEVAEILVPGSVEGSSFVNDLFGTALSKVNWIEIAECYRDEAEL